MGSFQNAQLPIPWLVLVIERNANERRYQVEVTADGDPGSAVVVLWVFD